MITGDTESPWIIASASVAGPKRVRTGTANQDAWRVSPSPSSPLAAAVADGHGASLYVRSDIGARLAADLATTELLSIAAADADRQLTLTDVKRAANERFPVVLHRKWVELATTHYRAYQLTEQELQSIEESGRLSLESLEATPWRIYGSTVLAVLLTDSYAVFVQLGDGDIIVAEHDASVQYVFESDPRTLGDETTSLASKYAWRDVRVDFRPFVDDPPALIMLSTDGYGKAFTSREDFLQVGIDMLSLAHNDGFAPIKHELSSWLEEASSTSGDDATAIVIGHAKALSVSNAMTSAVNQSDYDLEHQETQIKTPRCNSVYVEQLAAQVNVPGVDSDQPGDEPLLEPLNLNEDIEAAENQPGNGPDDGGGLSARSEAVEEVIPDLTQQNAEICDVEERGFDNPD